MARILVIEDEPDQTKLIRLRLEARGHRVLLAAKAREGIDVAVREKPDLVLLDMILPDMHGLHAAIRLKRNPETRAIPIIALSAVGSPDFTKACLQEGIVAYVRKPYDPRELFKTIEKYVRVGEAPRVDKPRAAAGGEKSYQDRLTEIERQFKPKSPHPPPTPASKAAPERSSKSVLIVDDDLTFGRLVSAHLTDHGYEVRLAPDGVSGLKEAFLSRPDLVLLNLILPDGGVETVLSNLRKAPEWGGVPVFIMSSLLSPKKLEEKAREFGAQGFISKPIDAEDLLFIIESVIGG
jgi:CheY-like chemotaxis protein